jgi:hypothetical protein
MRIEKIGGRKVELYDSIDELPIKRFHKFNKYLLIDSGIGCDIDSINEHIAKIGAFLKDQPDEAKKQLENLRQSLYFIMEEMNPRSLSFIVLIHKIDDVLITDLSDNNIKNLSDKLSCEKVSFIHKIMESVKKKLDFELGVYFPTFFSDVVQKEILSNFKEKVILQLDSIIKDVDNNDRIDKIDHYLLTFNKPHIFTGANGDEVKYDKNFEELCILVQNETRINIDVLTIFQFYTILEYLKKEKTNLKNKVHG